MKNLLWIAGLILLPMVLSGQDESMLALFEDQVDAFNNGDIKRLVDNVSDDFKWYYITSDTLLLEVEGKVEFEKSMKQYFTADYKTHSTIESYTIDKNRLSFKEVASYQNMKGKRMSTSSLGVYEIKDDKIFRVWYFTGDQ